jgi:hypothetical protein
VGHAPPDQRLRKIKAQMKKNLAQIKRRHKNHCLSRRGGVVAYPRTSATQNVPGREAKLPRNSTTKGEHADNAVSRKLRMKLRDTTLKDMPMAAQRTTITTLQFVRTVTRTYTQNEALK